MPAWKPAPGWNVAGRTALLRSFAASNLRRLDVFWLQLHWLGVAYREAMDSVTSNNVCCCCWSNVWMWWRMCSFCTENNNRIQLTVKCMKTILICENNTISFYLYVLCFICKRNLCTRCKDVLLLSTESRNVVNSSSAVWVSLWEIYVVAQCIPCWTLSIRQSIFSRRLSSRLYDFVLCDVGISECAADDVLCDVAVSLSVLTYMYGYGTGVKVLLDDFCFKWQSVVVNDFIKCSSSGVQFHCSEDTAAAASERSWEILIDVVADVLNGCTSAVAECDVSSYECDMSVMLWVTSVVRLIGCEHV